MTADEIRTEYRAGARVERANDDERDQLNSAVLIEIAAQLAELNGNIRDVVDRLNHIDDGIDTVARSI